MSSPRAVAFLGFVAVCLAILGIPSVIRACGRHDTAPHGVDASMAAATLKNASWVTARGHVDPATLMRGKDVVAFRLQERKDGLVFVVPASPGSPFDEAALRRDTGLLSFLDSNSTATLSAAAAAYVAEEHELTGVVFEPDVGLNGDTVHTRVGELKLTGLIDGYRSGTSCPWPLRAVVVGERPSTWLADVLKALGYAITALVACVLAFYCARRRRDVAPRRDPQTAGETCDTCDATIVLEREGTTCASCSSPVHSRCLGAHASGHVAVIPYRV